MPIVGLKIELAAPERRFDTAIIQPVDRHAKPAAIKGDGLLDVGASDHCVIQCCPRDEMWLPHQKRLGRIKTICGKNSTSRIVARMGIKNGRTDRTTFSNRIPVIGTKI